VAHGEAQRYRDMLTQERETADRQKESLRQQATLQAEKSRADTQAETDRLRHELSATQALAAKLQSDLSVSQMEAQQRLDELREELQQAHVAQAGASQSDALQRQFKQWEDERSRLQMRIDEQLQERATLDAELQQLRDEARGEQECRASAQGLWEAERNKLEAQLAEAQLQAEQGPLASADVDRLRAEKKQLEAALAAAHKQTDSAGSSQEMDDLRRRFEMAVQDVRELKTKNAELTEQIAKAKAVAGKAAAGAVAAGNLMDWESRKQQLLASLEADFDGDDEQAQTDKLTIEGTIRMTDQIVADKERELIELRKLLEDQSSNIGGLAVGAAAIAGMLDGDELIKQERENLKLMQQQMQEQLKQAEIDISVERARLARERQELDEKIRNIEQEQAKIPAAGKDAPAGDGKKKSSGGGRWLSRLGLKDADGN
jgi:hypothetical protein